MKKFLSIILTILMVVTMIPMAVMPASAATEATELSSSTFITYSDGVTQYLKHDNYLYKVTFTNLKNIERLSFVIQYDYLRIKPQDSGITNLLANDGSTNLKKSDFPNSEGGVLNCYSTNTKRVIDTNKPIVIITCMAVNEPVWSWSDSSATAAFTSTDGKATMTVNATIESSEQTAVTCLENDKTTYTATATANGKEYTNVKTIYGEQGPHNFEYIESGDYMIGSCTNGCGTECVHENQTGDICEICGCHIGSYENGFCTECDAYEPAELKDGYYQIKNGGQLFWYANYINTVDRTANAVLTADIDLENRPWTPIGSTGENSNNFRGIFDGQNYTIRGLYVEGSRAGLGFFGEVRTGTVKNFTIFGEVVVNTEVDYVGGVIGSICGVNGENDLERNGAIIQNITSYVNLTAKAHGVGKIGGFVGYANHQSLIENCSWYGTFDAGKYRVDNGAGGFIGRIQENSSEVTIRNCGAYGTIKTNYAGDYNNTATIYMGGFLSFSNTNAQTTLENCLFAGRFERGENLTDQAFLGAFGTLRSVKAIKNCYYLGDDGLEAVHSDSNLKPGSDNVEITKATEEQLKSGEIAYKLQEANEIWGQSIGTDDYPVLGGEDVYCGYTACDDEAMVYTNDSTVGATKPDHSWGEGSLTRPTKTQDGYYTYTCSACGETKTEPVLRAANYDDYTKALEDLRAYLDSDMLTDENKSYISEWLATYDTDEAFSFIAGEEATVQQYIDATAYYASEFEAAIEDCLAGNHSGNGETCSVCGATIKFATVTDGTNTYYAADAATLNQAVTAILETGSRTFTVELPADTEAEMITAIRRAICDTEGVADGSINLTLKGVTSIPGTTNWDGVAFGPGDIYDEAGEIVDQELVTQLASINLPDATEIGAQAFYVCENLVSVSAPKAQTIGENAFAYTALTSVEFPELTAIPGTMLGGTWTLSSAKFPKVTTIEQNGLMIGFGFAPENNPTAFPLELTAEGDITFNGSNHFNIASQNYSGKVDLVLNIDKKDQVTFNDDGTATWQVRDDLSYTFKSITFTCTDGTTNHSYTYTDNGDGTHDMVCTGCGYVVVYNEAHSGGTATCTEQAKCERCGASYGEVDKNNHDETVAYVNGFCPNCDAYEPAKLVNGVYEISNAGNLYWFADKVTNENAAYGSADAILTCDIRVNEGTMTEASTGARVWTPIGKLAFGVRCPYTGTFEGNGKTVSGLYFNDTSANFSVGLFSLVGEGGKVQNVGIADSYLCGSQNIGAVVGNNFGTVTGCYNTGTVIGSGNTVGGVVSANDGTVTNCYNTGTVSGENSVGGVVGSNNGTVTGCYNTGTVSGSDEVGGVAGDNSHSTVEGCYNTGTVNGESSVGGVAGSGSTTQGCYNTGTVSGTNNVGGVVGIMVGEAILMGCYNSGSVIGSRFVGGVVGYNNATVTGCYFDSTVYTGDAIGGGSGTATDVEGKSTEQFASGEVAYLLSQGENGSIWGQTIGTDPAPVFSDAKVYYGYTSCGDTVAKYTNDETISAEKPDHTQKPTYTDNGNGTHSAVYPCCGTTVTEEHDFENDAHQCDCGYACPHEKYTDGVCDKCGYECAHTWDEDGYCRKCKTFCKHENNVNGVCTVCDYVLTFSVITGDTVSYYDSFDDALENAEEGSTVKLMKGIEQIASYEINKAITFDLNGNNWDTGSSDYIDVYAFVTFTDSVGTGNLNLSLNLYAPCLFNSGTYKGIGIMFETEDTLDDYLAECHGFFDHYTGEFKDVSDEKYVMGAKVDVYHKLGAQTCKGYQCEECGEYFGEADPDAHDWSNKDGICVICGEECAHEWDEGVLTRPVYDAVLGSKDGYYTYTCIVCAKEKKETVKSADYSAYEAVSVEINTLLQSDELTFEAKQEIYSAAIGHGLLSNDLTESEQNKVDDLVAELEKIIADAEEKIASGEYVKADYTEIDEAIDDIEEKLASENVTDEGKAELEEIKKQLEEMKADENTSAADVAELEKALEDYEEELDKGIEDGTLVMVDGDKIAVESNKKFAEKLEAEGLTDEYEDFLYNQKATDEAFAAEKEINDFANSLEGTVAENAENIAKLNEMLDSLYSSFENCLRGTHNFKDYEITSPAKCEVNAIETGTCWFCGETDEREVEGTALEHSFTKYEVTEEAKCGVAGKEVAYCDHGCGETDERETPALEHVFGKYTSNGDATCTADGTKTATCIHGCGETDTVADEGSMIDHSDEDGDKLCDDCQSEIIDTCPDCGGPAHEDTGVPMYICIIITFIRLLISFIEAIS